MYVAEMSSEQFAAEAARRIEAQFVRIEFKVNGRWCPVQGLGGYHGGGAAHIRDPEAMTRALKSIWHKVVLACQRGVPGVPPGCLRLVNERAEHHSQRFYTELVDSLAGIRVVRVGDAEGLER